MAFRVLADVAMVAHFGYLAYLVVGGFLAWRWPRTIWLHLAAVVWAGIMLLFSIDCPLTFVENWGRERAGHQGLPSSGFIDHYLTGVVYPEESLVLMQVLVGLAVGVSWLGLLMRWHRARTRPVIQA